jgi:general nucleoside transport system permease protein
MLLTGANPIEAYGALVRGAVGSPDRIAASLSRSTPFIGASLAIAFAFRAGLFNIGAEGQLLIGALFGGWAGTWAWLQGAPAIIALPVVLVFGALGGALYGGFPGFLKARTGAHEVIVTIMLNTIALRLLEWLVLSRDPVILLDESASVPHSRPIAEAAQLPLLPFSGGSSLHWGLVLAVLLCAGTWFMLERTTTGFEIKTVGLAPSAATYAGMSVPRTWILTMAVSGAMAGFVGASEVSGSTGFIQPGVFRNIGFDSIAIALLARANPWAVIPAALLWGALLSGAPLMQVQAGLSLDIVRIVQALILLFVAADLIVRRLFRIRGADDEARPALASGWGG